MKQAHAALLFATTNVRPIVNALVKASTGQANVRRPYLITARRLTTALLAKIELACAADGIDSDATSDASRKDVA